MSKSTEPKLSNYERVIEEMETPELKAFWTKFYALAELRKRGLPVPQEELNALDLLQVSSGVMTRILEREAECAAQETKWRGRA
jgi:hypothetical protein